MRNPYLIFGVGVLIFIGLVAYFVPREGSNQSFMSTKTFTIESPVFSETGMIPEKYTCDGDRLLSPPLSISNVPAETKSLALIVIDPDVPKQLKPDGTFDHWILFNIPPETNEIAEGGSVGTPGVNGAGKSAYTGPCPPPQHEPKEHRYFFTLYALDATLLLLEGATKDEVLVAMKGHELSNATVIGRYSRAR